MDSDDEVISNSDLEYKIKKYNNVEFLKRFRLEKHTVKYILSLIEQEISSQTERNYVVTAEQKLMVTLRYYATGGIIRTCSDFVGIDVSSGGRAVSDVSAALTKLRTQFINFPQTGRELKIIQDEFYKVASFPMCIGALDCTHIRILSPGGDDAENYRNRKGYFSINVQTICDTELRIQNIVARWPGSAHDSTIFLHSKIRRKLEKKEFGDVIL